MEKDSSSGPVHLHELMLGHLKSGKEYDEDIISFLFVFRLRGSIMLWCSKIVTADAVLSNGLTRGWWTYPLVKTSWIHPFYLENRLKETLCEIWEREDSDSVLNTLTVEVYVNITKSVRGEQTVGVVAAFWQGLIHKRHAFAEEDGTQELVFRASLDGKLQELWIHFHQVPSGPMPLFDASSMPPSSLPVESVQKITREERCSLEKELPCELELRLAWTVETLRSCIKWDSLPTSTKQELEKIKDSWEEQRLKKILYANVTVQR